MSNENQNNTGNWKNKLDELDSLPGETMPDKNIFWEKLHGRLRGKKRGKKITWYWAAAACLLLALITIPWIDSNKTRNNISQNNIQQSQIKSPFIQKKLSINKDTIAMISIIPEEKKHAPKIEIKNNSNKIIGSKKEPSESKNQIAVNKIISSAPATDSIVATIAITPAVKKLKVVHVNELGDPVDVSSDLASKRELHSFQLELASQEVYINSPVAFNKTGFTILKTKSSPN